MKKLLTVLAVVAAALFTFGWWSNQTEAQRPAFGKKDAAEYETAKQIALKVLRARASVRAVGVSTGNDSLDRDRHIDILAKRDIERDDNDDAV